MVPLILVQPLYNPTGCALLSQENRKGVDAEALLPREIFQSDPRLQDGAGFRDIFGGDCQNYGPFLGSYYNKGPNLGDPKRDHNFDNPRFGYCPHTVKGR